MKASELTKKLKKAQKLSKELDDLLNEIRDYSEERYGVSYTDANEDGIIDAIEYGTGKINARIFHNIMKAHIN